MNSKLALKKLIDYTRGETPINLFTTIQQDLDKLENLEEENKVLLVNKNVAQGIAKKLKKENDKLKKAIEILKEHNLQVNHIPDFTTPYISLNDYGDGSSISIKEYKLLKEVLGND